MTHEWKDGDRAMVQLAWVSDDGEFCTLKNNIGHTVVQTAALRPLPPTLTPEDAAVLEAADLFAWVAGKPTNHHADDYRTLYQAIQARISARAARQSPPVPADSAGKSGPSAEPPIKLGNIVECIDDSGLARGYLTKGTRYTVFRLSAKDLWVKDDMGNLRGYFPHRFRLVSRAEEGASRQDTANTGQSAADSAGQPESVPKPDTTPPQVTELLYPLPDGSAVLLSDVRKINVTKETDNSFVYLALVGNIHKSIPFANADAARAYADTIRELVNAARSGKPYTGDTGAPTEKAPQPAAPAFKVGDRVRRQDVSEGVVEIGSNGNDICYVKWDHGSWSWCQINCLSSISPAADTAALRDAVVEAAKAWEAQDPETEDSHVCMERAEDLAGAVRALLAAEAPPAPRDPVEELREAAEEIIRLENQAVQSGADVARPARNALDRLRAALAAMKDAQ